MDAAQQTMSKPARKQRPKPPPYPRPVPHFVVEELPPTPKDIAWSALNGGGHYSDEDEVASEQRAAKRRRIETCAQAYLRGESLYIMTAQLKGPFNQGWRNPWAKKKQQVKSNTVAEVKSMEIPETTRKIPSSIEETKAKKIVAHTSGSRPSSRERVVKNVGQKSTPLDHAPSPFTSRVYNLAGETSPKVPKQVKEKRVEEWLRRNETFANTGEILVHSSPTPVARHPNSPKEKWEDVRRYQGSQSEPIRGTSPHGNAERVATSFQNDVAVELSEAKRRVQRLSKDIQNIMTEPIVHVAIDLQNEVRKLAHPVSSSRNGLDSSRAEFAILNAKRSALERVPADAHMSPFEFRKVPGTKKAQEMQNEKITNVQNAKGESSTDEQPGHCDVSEPAHANHTDEQGFIVEAETSEKHVNLIEDDLFATAPQSENVQGAVDTAALVAEEPIVAQEIKHTTDTSRPVLSTAVSEISTNDMLPSAQPRPELPHSVSSIARDDGLISIKPVRSASDKVEGQNSISDKWTEEDKTSTAEIVFKVPSTLHAEHNVQHSTRKDIEASTPVPVYKVAELNTQEMLANMEPLELSTIKKPKALAKKDTPVTATKARSDRKRKKASFAMDPSSMSSHGSIQEAMKAKIGKKLGSPPLFVLGKDDLDIEVSDDENESRYKKPRRSSSVSKPKSILKSTNITSSPISVRRLKNGYSTSREQDGQQLVELPPESGQNLRNEDNFDLDAAIDDLGSFLGTWDAEKEASSLNIEL